MIALLAACRPPDTGSNDSRYTTPTIEDTDRVRVHTGNDSGSGDWRDEHCARAPCVAQVPHRVFEAPPGSSQYVGYDVAASAEHVLVGAPFVLGVEPRSGDRGRVYRLDRQLGEGAEWLGDPFDVDGMGLDVLVGGAADGVVVLVRGEGDDQLGARVEVVPVDSRSERFPSTGGIGFQTVESRNILSADLSYDDALLVSISARDGTRGNSMVLPLPRGTLLGEHDASLSLTSRYGMVTRWWDADHDGIRDIVVWRGIAEVITWSSAAAGDLDVDDLPGWSEACSPACDFGQFTTVVPDIDGDGFSDLAVGAPQRESDRGIATGRLYLVPGDGPPGDIADVASVVIEGDEEGQAVGFSAAAGDLDGDGVADLVVGGSGVWGARTPGEVLVFRGPVAPGLHLASDADLRLFGERSWDLFGRTVAILPSIDGGPDGLLVGAPGADGASGAVYLVEGDDLPWR